MEVVNWKYVKVVLALCVTLYTQELYVRAPLRSVVTGAQPPNSKLSRNGSFTTYTQLSSTMDSKGKCVSEVKILVEWINVWNSCYLSDCEHFTL